MCEYNLLIYFDIVFSLYALACLLVKVGLVEVKVTLFTKVLS